MNNTRLDEVLAVINNVETTKKVEVISNLIQGAFFTIKWVKDNDEYRKLSEMKARTAISYDHLAINAERDESSYQSLKGRTWLVYGLINQSNKTGALNLRLYPQSTDKANSSPVKTTYQKKVNGVWVDITNGEDKALAKKSLKIYDKKPGTPLVCFDVNIDKIIYIKQGNNVYDKGLN